MQPDEPVFDRVLRPSPPMPPRALLTILIIVGGLNFLIGGYFLLQGAWPVLPFLGADVTILAWAFRASVRASKREEQITLTPDQLQIICREPGRQVGEYYLNPYWVRVQLDESPEHARDFHGAVPQAGNLVLWSHGKGLTVGGFLSPMVRAEFGHDLKNALARVRGS